MSNFECIFCLFYSCEKILTIPALEICRNADPNGLMSFYEACLEDICAASKSFVTNIIINKQLCKRN